MDPNNYEVAFNIAQEPYRGWLVAAIPLIIVAVGLGALFMGERTSTKAIGIFGILFASALTVVAQLGSWQEYQRLQRSFHEGHFSDVEGRIEDFQRNPDDPYDSDVFHLGDHRFEIVGPRLTTAYHQNQNSGGMNLNHRCVRIFFTDRNEIIWLGIRKSGCEPMEALQPESSGSRIGFWDP